MTSSPISRRQFIAASGVAAGAGLLSNRAAFGANDRISIGIIGTGSRGAALFREIAKLKESHNVTISAVCDVWRPNREGAAKRVEEVFGAKPFTTSRFGEVLARDDVDAVVIATPDFGHTPIMIEALKANKDVYVEKPMSLDVEKANEAVNRARANGCVVQVGTQRRSEGRWQGAHDFIASGKLGHVSRIAANNFNHARWARNVSDCKEEDVDWEAYLFNREMRPFDPNLLRRWHFYKMCTNGIAGLWLPHLIDAAHMVMGSTYPRSATALGGIYVWDDGREHTDTFHALLDYPEDYLFSWGMGLGNAAGTHYTVHGEHGTIDLEAMTVSDAGGRKKNPELEGKLDAPSDQNHMANWVDCMRSRERPNADIAYGHMHAVATIMAAEALHTGNRMRYDVEARRMHAG